MEIIDTKKLSRKYESLKLRKKEKGEATRQNIQKQIAVVHKAQQDFSNIRENYVNQTINEMSRAADIRKR